MEFLLSHCAGFLSSNTYSAFFVGGLTGGFTHCLPMCGPYAACDNSCTSSCTSRLRITGQDTALLYHFGRLTTYGLLGLGVALLAMPLQMYSWWPTLSSALLACAGAMFLFSCLKSCLHAATPGSTRLTYWRGVLLGFMPCGLLYAALMMAATLKHPVQGMLAMWLFTLGTIPALLIASGGVGILRRKWQHPLRMVGRGMMAWNGISLLLIAMHPLR